MVKTAHFKTLSSVLEDYWSLINWIWSCLRPVIPVFFQFFSLYIPRLYCHFVMEATYLFPNFTSLYRQGNFSWDLHVPKVSSTPDLDDFWGNLGCENGLCLYCCDQKATWRGKGLFHFTAYTLSSREGRARTHGRNLGAGTDRGRARVLLVGFFFLMTCSACSLITLRITSPGWQCLQWTESAQIINHENVPQVCHRPTYWRLFLNGGSLFQNTSNCVM